MYLMRSDKPIPNKDGVVRQAEVKTASGKIFRRPVVKPVVLETSQNDEEETARPEPVREGDFANSNKRVLRTAIIDGVLSLKC